MIHRAGSADSPSPARTEMVCRQVHDKFPTTGRSKVRVDATQVRPCGGSSLLSRSMSTRCEGRRSRRTLGGFFVHAGAGPAICEQRACKGCCVSHSTCGSGKPRRGGGAILCEVNDVEFASGLDQVTLGHLSGERGTETPEYQHPVRHGRHLPPLRRRGRVIRRWMYKGRLFRRAVLTLVALSMSSL